MRGFIDDRTAVGVLMFTPTSQSAFMRGFIDDGLPRPSRARSPASLNPRSCAASSMTGGGHLVRPPEDRRLNPRSCAASSMTLSVGTICFIALLSQSAFMRGFIDDAGCPGTATPAWTRLNPRSCAASSMTRREVRLRRPALPSQSAFMRGFIDDLARPGGGGEGAGESQSAFMRGFIDDPPAAS